MITRLRPLYGHEWLITHATSSCMYRSEFNDSKLVAFGLVLTKHVQAS